MKQLGLKQRWKSAWQIKSFRISFSVGLVLLLAILAYFPFFFNAIENREGRMLSDFVLRWLTPRDLSLPVFLLIWASFFLLMIRLLSDPGMALLVLWSYNLLPYSEWPVLA